MNEFQELEWDEFENSDTIRTPSEGYVNIEDEDMNILDREHLLSFVNEYRSEEEQYVLSEGEDIFNDPLRITLRRHSSDKWSIQTPRKCARLAASRSRSISVSVNFMLDDSNMDRSDDDEWSTEEVDENHHVVKLKRSNVMRRRAQ